MFNRLLTAALLTITSLTTCAEIPDVNDFRIVPQFPQPADGAFGVVGTATGNGRFILWDGDTVYLQDESGSDKLTPIASGYAGDPGFVALAPNGHTLLMGAGFTPTIYLLDINDPADYEVGDGIDAPSHFSGGFLNANLIILDRSTDDFSATELVVLDLDELNPPDSLTRAAPTYQTIMKFPALTPETRATIIDKPEFSFSGKIHVNQNRSLVYAMDSNTKELRAFQVSDLIDAFENSTMLDWTADGALIGETGDFFTGGVIGENTDGELLIDGSEAFGSPGGIMYIDPEDPATIIATLDPAGNQPFYYGIYNRSEDELIAIDSTFGEPLRAYARETGIAPVPARNPCDSFVEIFEQWNAFSLDFGLDPLTADLDADGIPDQGALLLFQNMSCGEESELRTATHVAYDLNLDAIDDEFAFRSIEDYRELIAALMVVSLDMQSAVTTILADDGVTLLGSYLRVTCTDGECLPDFEEKENPFLLVTTRATNEPYSGTGDLDQDGTTNIEEYNNVIANGGDITDYAVAAAAHQLDGSSTLERHASNSGCFIATAAYGTPLAGEIGVLREIRDSRLMTNPLGALFVDTYYRVSPPVADQVAQNDFLRSGVQFLLKPILLIANLFNSSLALILLGLSPVLLCFTVRVRRRKVAYKTSL